MILARHGLDLGIRIGAFTYGDDRMAIREWGEGAALTQVNGVIARLQALLPHDPRLREILEVLEPAQIQLQEGAGALRRYGERAELDPQRLREVEQRLDALHAAARKYRVDPDGLADLAGHTRQRLLELGAGGDPETLRRRETEAEAAYRDAAGRLTAGRRKAAKKLAAAVTAGMQELAMQGGVFEVALEPLAVVLLPVGPLLVVDQLPDSNPTKKPGMEYKKLYEGKHGPGSLSGFGGHAWDSYLIFAAAVPEAWRISTLDSSTQYSAMKNGICTRIGRQPPSGLTFSSR